jgi:catechol 2,3-dioxygenase-like lactoylglutathione lyase family enzyme
MVEFYRHTLGMKVVAPPEAMDYGPKDWVQLRSGSFEVGIHKAGKPGCPERNRNKLVLLVNDVSAARSRLIDCGVRMGKHHVASEYESCDFKDPDGNILQLSNR